METVKVFPGEGRRVLDPRTSDPVRPVPAEGTVVPLTSYWNRRLRCGDLVREASKPKLKSKKVE